VCKLEPAATPQTQTGPQFISQTHDFRHNMSQRALAISSKALKSAKEKQKNGTQADITSLTAEEYLALVSLEARSITQRKPVKAETTDSNVRAATLKNTMAPIDGSLASLQYLMSSRTDIEPVKDVNKMPSGNIQGFCDGTIADFSALRLYMHNCAIGGVGVKNLDVSKRIPVPPMKDGAGWHEFILGKDEAEGNVGGYFDDDESSKSENDSDANLADIPEWRMNIPKDGHLPTVSLLLQMEQIMARRVLGHHADWLEQGFPVTKARCVWIYALLARLDKPIHRDDAAVLRRILKELCKARNIDKQRKVDTEAINVVIAIIGRYFEQSSFDEIFRIS